MLKFLRKYQKWLLVIFGTFLMLVFVAPQAVSQFGKRQLQRTFATIGDEKISIADQQLASQEREAVKSFFSQIAPDDQAIVFVLGDDTDHWLLLTHAAEQGGFVGEAPDGADLVESLVQPIAWQLGRAMAQQLQQSGELDQLPSDEQLIATARQRVNQLAQSAANSARLRPDQFNMAMAKVRGIFRMYDAYIRIATPSEPSVLHTAQSELDELETDYLIIPGAYAVPDNYEPTENEIKAHFDRYRAIEPADSEFGISYILPPRVKLEWIKLDRSDLLDRITIDPIAVMTEYRKHPEQYPGDRTQALAQIEQQLRDRRADEIMDEADSLVRGQILGIRRSLDPDGRYRVIPPDWQRPALAEIAEHIQRELTQNPSFQDTTIPLPEYQVRDASWLTSNDLRSLEGIGTAIIHLGTEQIPFAQAALSVRAIAGDNPFALQVGLPAVDARADDPYSGDRYYFTVIDAKKRSPADSLDEVYDQVITDMRSIAGFEQLQAQLPELIALAGSSEDGLTLVADRVNPAPSLDETPDEPESPDTTPDESPDTSAPSDGDTGADSPADGAADDTQPDDESSPAVTSADDTADKPDPLPPLLPTLDVMVRPNRVYRISPEQMAQFRQQFGQLPPDFDTDPRINTESFRDALFAIARRIDPTKPVDDSLTLAERTTGQALPKSLSVVVARVDSFTPLTIERFRLQVQGVTNQIRQREIGFIGDAFSFDALSERLQFVREQPRDDEDNADAKAASAG